MHGKFDDLGRFADPSLLVLTSLSDGPKHGYAIMADVAEFSGVRMEPGTLYGALARLERRGWVRPLATEERRRPYEITTAGHPAVPDPGCPAIPVPGRLPPGGAGGSATARRYSRSLTSTT